MLYRLTISGLSIALIVLAIIASPAAADDDEGIRRLSRWRCTVLGPGKVKRCRTRGLDLEIVMTDVMPETVLLTRARLRNDSDEDLCVSLDKHVIFGGAGTVTLRGNPVFQEGRRRVYGMRFQMPGIQPSQELQEVVTMIFRECEDD